MFKTLSITLNKNSCLLLLVFALIQCNGDDANETCAAKLEQFNFLHAQEYQEVEKVAVIIEPRNHPLLIPIVENVLKILGPEGWKIQIFHGTHNLDFIKNSKLSDFIKNGSIMLTNIQRENLSVKQYSNLVLSAQFWENIFGETILIFQTDSVLCSTSPHKIEEFIKWDFVGAPFDPNGNWEQGKQCSVSANKIDGKYIIYWGENKGIPLGWQPIGNGGLSLRKKSKTLEILKIFHPSQKVADEAEDRFYTCAALHSESSWNIPETSDAKKFSVDSIFSDSPFGVHKPWASLTQDEMIALQDSCFELKTILKPHYSNRR